MPLGVVTCPSPRLWLANCFDHSSPDGPSEYERRLLATAGGGVSGFGLLLTPAATQVLVIAVVVTSLWRLLALGDAVRRTPATDGETACSARSPSCSWRLRSSRPRYRRLVRVVAVRHEPGDPHG